MNLSRYVEENECNLNLFIGRVVFEERPDGKISFNPYVMLHSEESTTSNSSSSAGQTGSSNQPTTHSLHSAFARVPSLFGGVGYDMQKTKVFDAVEVDGVALLQYTIEVKSVLTQFHAAFDERKLYEYFEELMAVEMECKLKVAGYIK